MPNFRPQQIVGSSTKTILQGAASFTNNAFTANPNVSNIIVDGYTQSDGYVRVGGGTVSTTGLIRTANNTSIVNARNAANSADVGVLSINGSNIVRLGGTNCVGWELTINAGNVLQGDGGAMYVYGGQSTFTAGQWYAPAYTSNSSNPALSGLIRGVNNSQLVNGRNSLNDSDINLLSTNSSDTIVIGNTANVRSGVSILGGTRTSLVTGTGGPITIQSGDGYSGVGGDITITAGNGIGGTFSGGNISITSGLGASTGASGTLTLASADSVTGISNVVTLKSGNGTATSVVGILTGNASSTSSGSIAISTGTAVTTSGSVVISTGNSTTTSGSINLSIGAAGSVGSHNFNYSGTTRFAFSSAAPVAFNAGNASIWYDNIDRIIQVGTISSDLSGDIMVENLNYEY